MKPRHVLILLLAAVALTAFSIALSRRDSRDWRANRSRRLLPFPWQDAAAIDVTRPGKDSLRLRRDENGEWKIHLADDIADVVSPHVLEELTALATLTWREPQPGRLPPDPQKAVVLAATATSGQKVTFSFGDTANNLRAVCIDGDESTVYGVNQDLLGFLDWPTERFRNYFLFDRGDGRKPDKIIVSPDASDESLTLTLERDGDGWRLVSPVDWAVDATRFDLLLRWLGRLRADGIAAEMTGDAEWFGFNPPTAYVEAWYNRPQRKPLVRRVEFGKAEEGKIFARETGRSPIFTVPSEALAEISMDVATQYPAQWRNFYRQRGLNLVGSGSPDSVVIEQLLPEPSTLTLTRHIDRDGARWLGVLEKDGASRTFAVEPPDAAEPMRPLTALFTGLASIRVKAFLADVAPGPETVKWTAFPAWRLTASAAGSPPATITVYAANSRGELPSGMPYAPGDAGPRELVPMEGYPDKAGFAFSLADTPAVMETYGEMAYLLCLPPYRYQSRRLLDIEPRAFAKITLKGSAGEATYFRQAGEINEQWWRDPDAPEPLMDDNNRFVAAMLELSQLRSDGFVEEANGDIAKFGLDQPGISAIVYSSSGEAASSGEGEKELFTLVLGAKVDDDGKRYARLNNAGPVFIVSSRLARALESTYH